MSPFLNPIFLISILIALSVHECAHAFMAFRLGDDTARDAGRLTLNPIAHLDPIGSILFLLVGFGWGKPVPVDARAFRHPKRDTALTALAGPLSNLVLAIICFAALMGVAGHAGVTADDLLAASGGGPAVTQFFVQLLSSLLFLNLGLMAFNLLPIAPLDGSKMLQAFVPLRYEDAYDAFMRRGPYILLGLLVAERLLGIDLLSGWIGWIMDFVLSTLTSLVHAVFG